MFWWQDDQKVSLCNFKCLKISYTFKELETVIYISGKLVLRVEISIFYEDPVGLQMWKKTGVISANCIKLHSRELKQFHGLFWEHISRESAYGKKAFLSTREILNV